MKALIRGAGCLTWPELRCGDVARRADQAEAGKHQRLGFGFRDHRGDLHQTVVEPVEVPDVHAGGIGVERVEEQPGWFCPRDLHGGRRRLCGEHREGDGFEHF